jgi:hypothetical protein
MAAFLGGNNAASNPLKPFSVGNGGAAELLHDQTHRLSVKDGLEFSGIISNIKTLTHLK